MIQRRKNSIESKQSGSKDVLRIISVTEWVWRGNIEERRECNGEKAENNEETSTE